MSAHTTEGYKECELAGCRMCREYEAEADKDLLDRLEGSQVRIEEKLDKLIEALAAPTSDDNQEEVIYEGRYVGR